MSVYFVYLIFCFHLLTTKLSEALFFFQIFIQKTLKSFVLVHDIFQNIRRLKVT